MPSLINSDDGVVSGTSGLKTTGANDGILALQNNGTTNVTVTAAGNVGIGTSSPTARLTVVTGAAGNNEGEIRISENATYYAGLRRVNASDEFRIGSYGASQNITFYTVSSEQARITSAGLFQFNSGYGSVATAYGCRAWVNFNGTGTVAIRASGNVSSITDNGSGDYTVNFTNAMPDANYTTFCSNRENYVSGTSDTWGFLYEGQPTTSATRVQTGQTAGKFDSVEVNVVIFR